MKQIAFDNFMVINREIMLFQSGIKIFQKQIAVCSTVLIGYHVEWVDHAEYIASVHTSMEQNVARSWEKKQSRRLQERFIAAGILKYIEQHITQFSSTSNSK